MSSHRQAHGMQNQHRVPLDSWLSWLLGHRHPARSSDIWHGRLRMLPATERKAFTTRWPSSVKACGEQQRTGLLSENGLSEAQGVAQDARSAHARSATASGQRPRTACVWQQKTLGPGRAAWQGQGRRRSGPRPSQIKMATFWIPFMNMLWAFNMCYFHIWGYDYTNLKELYI